MRHSFRKATAVVAVLALSALVACGDDDGDTAGTTSSTEPAQPVAEARADTIPPRADDLPPGWTPGGDPVDADDDFDDELERCLGVESEGERPTAESEFAQGDLTRLAFAVEMAPTADAAATELRAFEGADAAQCLATALAEVVRRLPGMAQATDPVVQALPFATVGDATVAYRATTSLLAGDGGTALTVDAVLFQQDEARMSILSLNPNRPLDITIVVQAANLMARRAAG